MTKRRSIVVMLKKYIFLSLSMVKNKLIYSGDFEHISWPHLIRYFLRQFRLYSSSEVTRMIKSYQEQGGFGFIDTPYGQLYIPKEMPINELNMIIREVLDSSHWHQYITQETSLNEDDIVVDCGSAEGFWSLSIADKVKRIYLIEPQSSFVSCVNKTFCKYINENLVSIMPFAVGKHNAKCTIDNSKGDISASVKFTEHGDIPLRTLDSLFVDENITFIKADVEGFEMDLIIGATELIKRLSPKISITVYHPSNEWREIRDYILSINPKYKWKLKGMVAWGKPLMLHMWV